MLSPRRAPDPSLAFTRRDATRFLIAAFLLITSLTAIFALDLVPQRLQIAEGDVASADIVAPRFASYIGVLETQAARDDASRMVVLKDAATTEKAIRIAGVQLALFDGKVAPIDNAFAADVKED